jgi:hypothetical protein
MVQLVQGFSLLQSNGGETYRRDREDAEAVYSTLALLTCPLTPSARQAAALTPSMAEEEITERVNQASHSAGS